MMLRGRHRGLPYALDRAILLPSEQLQKKEAEDADRRYRRGSFHVEPGYGAETMMQGATYNSGDAGDIDEMDMAMKSGSDQPSSPVGVGNGIDHSSPERRPIRRTTSRLSAQTSNGNIGNGNISRRQRSRSLSRIIVGGLSAGPSIPRHD